MKIYQFSCEMYLNIMGGKRTYTSGHKQDEKSGSPGLGALLHGSYISGRTGRSLLNG